MQVLQRNVRSQNIFLWNAFNIHILRKHIPSYQKLQLKQELNFSSIQSLVNSRIGILGNKRPTQRIVSDI